MSTDRIAPGAGRVYVGLLPTGPNGRPRCRYCRREVPRPGMTFCGPDCVHEHKVRTNPGYVRECVLARDRGICGVCRVDTVAVLKDLLARARRELGHKLRARDATPPGVLALLAQLGYSDHRFRGGSLWDADHIRPVALGGGECGLGDIQTLCLRCHARKSAVQRRVASSTVR